MSSNTFGVRHISTPKFNHWVFDNSTYLLKFYRARQGSAKVHTPFPLTAHQSIEVLLFKRVYLSLEALAACQETDLMNLLGATLKC